MKMTKRIEDAPACLNRGQLRGRRFDGLWLLRTESLNRDTVPIPDQRSAYQHREPEYPVSEGDLNSIQAGAVS